MSNPQNKNPNLVYFLETGYDEQKWAFLYHKHQQMYIRKRLNFLKELWQSKKFSTTLKKFSIDWQIAQNWLADFKKGDLNEVCKLITRQVKQRLSLSQKEELKEILLTKTPKDYDIDRHIWTAQSIIKMIKTEFDVELKDSRIYEILAELRLSHQKAHRDYANSDPEKQLEFQETLKKNWKKMKPTQTQK